MNASTIAIIVSGLAATLAPANAQDKPLLGIVSISATEANNVRYIAGATAAGTGIS